MSSNHVYVRPGVKAGFLKMVGEGPDDTGGLVGGLAICTFMAAILSLLVAMCFAMTPFAPYVGGGTFGSWLVWVVWSIIKWHRLQRRGDMVWIHWHHYRDWEETALKDIDVARRQIRELKRDPVVRAGAEGLDKMAAELEWQMAQMLIPMIQVLPDAADRLVGYSRMTPYEVARTKGYPQAGVGTLLATMQEANAAVAEIEEALAALRDHSISVKTGKFTKLDFSEVTNYLKALKEVEAISVNVEDA